MSELRSYLRGWMGYDGLAAQLKLFDRLDQWLQAQGLLSLETLWAQVARLRRTA